LEKYDFNIIPFFIKIIISGVIEKETEGKNNKKYICKGCYIFIVTNKNIYE